MLIALLSIRWNVHKSYTVDDLTMIIQVIKSLRSESISIDSILSAQVAIERGKRPVPFRTRKLRPSSLIILHLSGVET